MKLLEDTVKRIEPPNGEARARAHRRLERLTMPFWALGRIMDLAEELAGMAGECPPKVARKAVVVMAGDHGVTQEGISKYPSEVTLQMVYNFIDGGAGINALAALAGAEVYVVDMGVKGDLKSLADSGKIRSAPVAHGTQNMAVGPAMSREQAVRCIEAGIEIALDIGQSVDVLATGDMGIGNTTPSSAIVTVMTGSPAAEVTGRGTGIDDDLLQHKIAVIERAIEINRPDPDDAIDVLAKVGGFEIGGIAGLILGAAAIKKPVMIDGFISTAGALIAAGICPMCCDYMIAAHRSVERGHKAALDKLGKNPLIDLDLRLGEGTGAALALHFVDAAVKVLTDVATFDEAGVSEAD